MGIRVPGAEREEQIGVGEVPTPKIATPVQEAYGTGVAAAGVAAGKEVEAGAQSIATRAIQQNLWLEQANLYQSKEDYRNAIQGSLYDNSTTSKITDANGQEHEVPTGVLNRQGFAAQGATAEFDQTSQKLKDQYLSQFTTPRLKAMAARQFDGITSVYRGQVANHEATQIREGTAATFLSSTMNEVKAASGANDEASLNNSISSVQSAYMRYGAFKGMDPETIQKNMSQWTAKAVDNSVTNTLSQSGDLNAAKGLLDTMKDKIGVDDYDKISMKLDKGAESMQRNAVRINDLAQNKNALNILNDVSTQKIDWTKLNDIDNENVPEPFKMAVKNALQAKLPAGVDVKNLGYIPTKDKQFAEHMADVMSGDNQNQIVTSMSAALNNFGHGKISQQHLNILAKLAVMRGQGLPCKEDAVNGHTIDPKQVPIDAGINAINDWQNKTGNSDPSVHGEYLDAVSKGTNPKDAYTQAIKTNVLKNYPNSITLDKTPDAMGSASKGLTSLVKDDKGKPAASFKIDSGNGMVVPKTEAPQGKREGGKLMHDAKGNKAIVYPDGSYEET